MQKKQVLQEENEEQFDEKNPNFSVLKSTDNIVFCRKTLNIFVGAISESENIDVLFETLSLTFQKVLDRLVHTQLTDSQLKKDFANEISKALKDKLSDLVAINMDQIASENAKESRNNIEGDIYIFLVNGVFQNLNQHFLSNFQSGLSSDGVILVLSILGQCLDQISLNALKVLKRNKLDSKSILEVFINLTALKDPNPKKMCVQTLERLVMRCLFGNFGKNIGILPKNLDTIKLIYDNENLPLSKWLFFIRSLHEQSSISNDEICKKISSQMNSFVLNDKLNVGTCLRNLQFFENFLQSGDKLLSGKYVEELILPQIKFLVNRSLKHIEVCSRALSYLSKNYEIKSIEAIELWCDGLTTDEILFKNSSKEEERDKIIQFLISLASLVKQPELKYEFVKQKLLTRFKQSKQNQIENYQRQILIHTIYQTQISLNTEDLQILVEHFFQIQDERDLKDIGQLMIDLLDKQQNQNDLIISNTLKYIKKINSDFFKSNSQSINSGFQLQPLLNLLQKSDQSQAKLIFEQTKDSMTSRLSSENLKSQQNYSIILALGGFFAIASQKLEDMSIIRILETNELYAKYLMSPQGVINQLDFLQSQKQGYCTSYIDAKNHLLILQQLILCHYKSGTPFKPQYLSFIHEILAEFMLNEKFRFRQNPILTFFENVSQFGSNFTIPLYQALLKKVNEIIIRNQLIQKKENIPEGNEEQIKVQTLKISQKFQLMFKMIYLSQSQGNTFRKDKLSQQEFFFVLRLICNPLISQNNKQLMKIVRTLTSIFDKICDLNGFNREFAFSTYFSNNKKQIVQYALIERTGILSSDKILVTISKNILVCMGWQGHLIDYIEDLTKILNYKPIELAIRLKELVKKEASSIGFYDLLFYSAVGNDLSELLNSNDKQILNSELQKSEETSNDEIKVSFVVDKEKKVEPETSNMTPAQLQAAMLKKMAAAKAAPKKGGAKPAPTKAAPKPVEKKVEEKKVEEIEDKATKKERETARLIKFCDDMEEIKGRHVDLVWSILRTVNQMKEVNVLNYQDATLKFTIVSAIRLLKFPSVRFSTYFFLVNLFRENRQSPFYGIRYNLIKCLQSLQENRITQAGANDFLIVFQHFNRVADFGDMEQGFLQLILMLANFVLQNLEVNLSIKESALIVAQHIMEENPKVRKLDLVALTINMMKSNYIGRNLSVYLSRLIKKLTSEEIALMLQRLFDFDPIARQKFLGEILIMQRPLFCPEWFSTQMWILQFDEDFFSLSRKIWNRFGLVLRSGVLELKYEKEYSNIYHHLRTSNTTIFDMSVRATVAGIEILQNKYDEIVSDLLKFYFSEIVFVKQLNLDALKFTGDDNNFEGTKRFNRIALPQIIKQTCRFATQEAIEKLLDFFITVGTVDEDHRIARECFEAAESVIHAKGAQLPSFLLSILEKYIDQAGILKEQSLNNAIKLVGTLTDYLDKAGQKKLIQTYDKLLQILKRGKGKNGVNELVNKGICKITPMIIRFMEDKAKQVFTDQMKMLLEGKNEQEIRAPAYAIAGIVKGYGMKFLIEKDIIGILNRECFKSKKVDALKTQASLLLYETLSFSLGKSFEPFVKEILPNIMNSISDPREPVRDAANQANQQIISNFTNLAIRQIVPIYLDGLNSDNWRGKFAAVEAIGNMALCAPKQILGFLPDIVKALRDVLNDTHEKVHDAAIKAIAQIGSVIKCPEVAELLDIIIKALGNSNLYLNECLDMLLQTSFVHAIDAPSLSLLVPLVDIGLNMHDNSSKQKASQLVGNICSLTQDPEDLLPYMKILIPAIKNSLFDSIPEIRASAAKALGKLSKGLGLSNSIELLNWLKGNLNRKDLAASERSGAAQGLSEVISAHGDNFFSNQCKEIITNSRSQDIQMRESFRTVMSYLPTSYSNFVNYLIAMLPIMIEGLGDESEEVKKVSMRNVKICIQQYGKKASELLCKPILDMMFDKDDVVRMSSSILMYQLVKEMENDIIKSQPKYINMEMKYQILSAMFILKFDPVEKVMVQASQIWKSLIDAPVHILRMIIQTLIQMVFNIIQSPHQELQEMGLACMRGLVEKFGERIVNESLDIFEGYLERTNDMSQTSGINRVILNMASAASHRLLTQIKQRLISISDPFLISDDADIRSLATKVLLTIFRRMGDPEYTQQILEQSFQNKICVLVKTRNEPKSKKEIDNLISALNLMLDTMPELKIEDKIMKICGVPTHSLKKPLTLDQAIVLKSITSKVAPFVFSKKQYNLLYVALNDELTNDPISPDPVNDPDRLQAISDCFSELVACIPEFEFETINDEMTTFYDKCTKRGSHGYYVDLIKNFCLKSPANYERQAAMYTRNVIKHMNSPDASLVKKVIICVEAIFQKLSKESQFGLVPLIREIIEEIALDQLDDQFGEVLYKQKVSSIQMFESKEGVQTLCNVIQNSIMHGSLQIRIDSAYCFKYLIDFASPTAIKTELIKICGALIRVANEKFTPDLKLQIFLTFQLMLSKAAAFVKAMVAQLQTTFLKALSDPQANHAVRKVVIENLLLLIKLTPKADPIIKDLISQLEGDKIDGEQKMYVSHVLALILREKGKGLQESIQKQVQQVLTEIINERKLSLNDKVIVNSAMALGFFNYNSSTFNKNLPNAYDQGDNFEKTDYRVCLGLKLGVLMSGDPKIADLNQLQESTSNYIKSVLTTQSGVEEIDGKDITQNRPDEEIQRFDGALATLGFIMDSYVRRLYPNPVGSSIHKLVLTALKDSELLQKLNAEEDFSMMSKVYPQMLEFMTQLPVPSLSLKAQDIDQTKFIPEQEEISKLCLTFIYKNYMEFERRQDGREAVLNLLQLTYNNYLELHVSIPTDSSLKKLTSAYVRETIAELPQFQGILSSEMKTILSDIIFEKKK